MAKSVEQTYANAS